jgi:hypothetical protein
LFPPIFTGNHKRVRCQIEFHKTVADNVNGYKGGEIKPEGVGEITDVFEKAFQEIVHGRMIFERFD